MSSCNRYKKSELASLLGKKCCQLKRTYKFNFRHFFKFLDNQGELERTETTKKFC